MSVNDNLMSSGNVTYLGEPTHNLNDCMPSQMDNIK